MPILLAVYLIAGAALFLIGDLARGVDRPQSNWMTVTLAAAMAIGGWPLFWGYAIWSAERGRRA